MGPRRPEPSHDVDFVLLADDVPHALQVLDAAGLRVVEPPEDWLVKVYDGDALVDLIFRPAERPVTREQLDAANEVRVDSVVMPVQSATDLLAAKLLVLNEHYCDFARLFPHVRALREQVDWPALHEVVGHIAVRPQLPRPVRRAGDRRVVERGAGLRAGRACRPAAIVPSTSTVSTAAMTHGVRG